MKISSSIRPKQIEILEVKGNKVELALRDNILEVAEIDSLTKTKSIKYTYDEVRVSARNRDNLISNIKSNFLNWFTKGKRVEELQLEIEVNKKEIDSLINDGKQIKVNKQLDDGVNVSLDANAQLYLKSMELENENIETLDAVAELYLIISEGVM